MNEISNINYGVKDHKGIPVKFDIGLLHTEPDYQKRKQILTEYHKKTSSIKLVTA